jgi:hypothetical protein
VHDRRDDGRQAAADLPEASEIERPPEQANSCEGALRGSGDDCDTELRVQEKSPRLQSHLFRRNSPDAVPPCTQFGLHGVDCAPILQFLNEPHVRNFGAMRRGHDHP